MTRRWLPALAALAAAVATAPGAVEAQPEVARPRVAVVVDLIASLTPARATELGLALADALQRELEVDTIGGGDVERLMPAGGVPEGCVADRACIGDLGARLDASQLLFLSVVQVGTSVRIDATWVDVGTGEAVSRPRIELPADARAGEVFAAAAPRLLPDAPRWPPEGEGGPTAPPGPRRRMTPMTWAISGATVAALGGGIGLALSASGTYDRCERDPDSCDDATRNSIRNRALVADVLFAGALIGATTVTILYLRSGGRREVAQPAQTWLLAPTRDGAVAGVRVRF